MVKCSMKIETLTFLIKSYNTGPVFIEKKGRRSSDHKSSDPLTWETLI